MKKMETSVAVDESESCRSSVISDLDELEVNLYSYVHHERNSCFDEEYSTVFKVSSLEGVCQQNEILVENENNGQYSSSFENGDPKLFGAKENCPKISEGDQHGEMVDSACFLTHYESASSCFVQSSGSVVPVQSSGKKVKAPSGICLPSRDSSPPVLEVSSSDDLNPEERNLSKYRVPAASTPIKEYIVIDSSDEEVQIEFERVKLKSKKKKQRKKAEIKADIQINTRSGSQFICLDGDEDLTFSEKENVDFPQCGQGYENSENESPLCKSWTAQMVQFYDESWGGECINVSELQKTMSDDGWKVDVSDEFCSLTSKFQNQRYFGVNSKAWCTKCKQKGHFKNKCTEKTSPPRCHRCGSSRHQEYSCNQKLCLTCGRVRPSLVAVCQQCRQRSWKKCYVCQQPGHPPGCCPDLWRRFHATIAPGEIITPQKVSYKDPKNTYCCNCASRGHHVFQCKKDSFSDYTPMNPQVTSYVDPEVLLKFQNTCSRTSTNWENAGAVAPEYQDENREKQSYVDRGIKRPNTSCNKKKLKHRKLSENTALKTAGTKTVSQKQTKKPDKSVKRNEKKKSVTLKIKKGLRPEKRFCKKDKCKRSVDNENHPKPNSKLEKDTGDKKSSTMSAPPINEKETNNVDPKPGCVERIIALSPGHRKRIESEEGKEILKYVTDQFKGVTARVVGNPSGVLSLMGTANNIDHVKASIFGILNNKYGLDQLKSLNTSGNDRVKKPNKRAHVAVVRSKDTKKKFQNETHLNNQLEIRSKDKATIVIDNSDLRVKIHNNRCKIKKKPNEVQRLKHPLKNGKGNKLNHQVKQHHRENGLDDRCDHTRIDPNFDPVVNHSANTRHLSHSEVSKSSKFNKDNCEILHNDHQVNEEVAHSGIDGPGSKHSKAQFNVNQNKCRKRNKKKNGDLATDKLRLIKLDDGKNGKHPANNQAKKLQKKIANGLDKLGLITVEIGNSRKVYLDEKKYDHSRISKSQQFSRNS